ncbi:MAG: VOC family protein [Myxococcales bacterium]|nr:VOC family protein [Myxococcales bacterium]
MSEAKTRGVHHVGLTVRDLATTVAFFVDVLGFEELGGQPAYPAAFVSDGHTVLTLWQATEPATAAPFDRKRHLGLHHLALAVSPEVLDALGDRLPQVGGCEIEFPPEPVGAGPSRHMMVELPGSGIRVELRAEA